MFTPIKNEKMHVQVAEQIKMLIQHEKLKVGERLPSERELCKIFGVSRSTIREALTSLEILGYIEMRAGRGTYVNNINRVDNENTLIDQLEESVSPTEIFEARILIEPRLSGLAAQRAKKEDLEEIERVVASAKELSPSEIDEFEELDRKFHLLIAKAANNEVLYRFEESINNERMSKLWGNLKVKSMQKKGRVDRYRNEHEEILSAIRDRNPALAEKLTLKHLLDIHKNLFG
ncbi:MAG: FadR family transcriptional regulator [Syntrophomonadaceae bacterium]|nr:FadR family transcriptional regulator [Syntrophomonadaceae bacterium]